MKKFLKAGVISAFLLLCYYLFEPVITWGFGWNALPEYNETQTDTKVTDTVLSDAILKSQIELIKAKKNSQAPAISIAVGLNDEVVWAEARGYKDIATSDLVDTKTMFRIGSVSKAVTSVGLGKLLQQGKLSLDNKVNQYTQYFNNKGITIRQLASHTSGIRNYGTCFCFPIWEYHNNDFYDSIEESVAIFGSDKLLFEPGTSFSYSSYNYTLLSGAMEQVARKPFLNFMEDEVFGPLNMSRTSGDFIDKNIENKATFYEIYENEYKEVFQVDNSNKWAGGGLISTPTDLVKLGNSMLNSTILQRSIVDTLFQAQVLKDRTINPQHYALGWRHNYFNVFDGKEKVDAIHHGGTAAGSTALLILFPKYNLSMALMINKSSSSFQLFDYILPIAEMFITHIKEEPQKEHSPIQKP